MDNFSKIVKDHEKVVYNLCFRLCGNRDDAFDLSQESFLKVWRSLPDFRGDSELSTWIYRLTSNTCIDFLRKKTRQKELLAFDDDILVISDDTYQPALIAERRELSQSLQKAMEELPLHHREVLTLREVAELSYKEIGEILSIEEGTVKSRIARARLSLRKILIDQGNISKGSFV